MEIQRQVFLLLLKLYMVFLMPMDHHNQINVGVIIEGHEDKLSLIKTAENINQDQLILKGRNISIQFYNSTQVHRLANFGDIITQQRLSALFGYSFTTKRATFVQQFHNLPMFAVTDHPGEKPMETLEEYQSFQVMLPSNKMLAKLTRKLLVSQDWKTVIVLYTANRGGKLDEFLWESEDIAKQMIINLHFKDGKLSNLTINVLRKLAISTEVPDAYILLASHTEVATMLDTVNKVADLNGLFNNVILVEPIHDEDLVTERGTKVIGFSVAREKNYKGLNAAKTIDKHHDFSVFLGDALVYYSYVLSTMMMDKQWNISRDPFTEELFIKALNKTTCRGLTGEISFNKVGHRKYVKFDIVNLQQNTFKKVGTADTSKYFKIEKEIQHNYKQSMTQIDLGRPLKVVTLRSTPFLFRVNENGTDKYYGLFIDMLNEMSAMMNCTYEFYIVADKEYGREVNGRWTGMVGDVLYRKADIAIAALTVTSLRQAVVQFTKPYMNLEIVYVRKASTKNSTNILLFFQPFSPYVWSISAAMLAVVSIAIYAVDYYSPYGYRAAGKAANGSHGKKFNFWNCVWFAATCTLQQGADRAPESVSGRIITGFFWVTALITISTYTANLAAYLTFKKTIADATNLEGFLKMNYSFSVVKTSALDSFFQASDYYVYRLMYEKIVAENTFVKSSKYGVLNSRARDDYIYIGEEPFVKKRLNGTPCDMVMVPGILPSMSFAFPVRKQSLLYHPVSNAIAKMLESGFIERRRKYYFDETHKCRGKLSPAPATTKEDWRVGADSMSGVYLFLTAGLGASLIALGWEHWWKKQIEKKMQDFANKVRVIGKTAVVVDQWKNTNVTSIKPVHRLSLKWNTIRRKSAMVADSETVTKNKFKGKSYENEDFKIEEID